MNQQLEQFLDSLRNQPNTGTTLMPKRANGNVGQLSISVSLVLNNEFGVRELTEDSERWLTNTIRNFVNYLSSDKHIERVSQNDVLGWIQHHREKELKPVSINSYLRGLRTFYNRLNKLGYTEHNPTSGIKFLNEGVKTPKAVSYSNYQKLLNVADTERDKAILATFWATGCRLGGLLSMDYHKDRLDLWYEGDQPCIAIHVIEKYSKPRWVYVGEKEAELLERWMEVRPDVRERALFLTKRGKRRLGKGAISALFRKLRRRANLPSKTISNPHSFRHAFAIRKLDEGYDLAVVSQWMGHNDPAFTASVYAVRSEAQLRAAFFKKKPRLR